MKKSTVRSSRFFSLLVFAFFGLFVSCTTVPPGPVTTYQQKSMTGYGYSEMQVNDSTYRVSFSGNENIDGNMAYTFFLTRCAELAESKNLTHFNIMSINEQNSFHVTRTDVISVSGSGNYATGVGHGVSDSKIKPSFTGEVQIYNGPKGLENEFEAKSIFNRGMEQKNTIDAYNEEYEKAVRKNATEWTIYYVGVLGVTVATVIWVLSL